MRYTHYGAALMLSRTFVATIDVFMVTLFLRRCLEVLAQKPVSFCLELRSHAEAKRSLVGNGHVFVLSGR